MSQTRFKVVENNNMEKENRNKSLEVAVSLIEKNYGKGSIMKLGSKANIDIESMLLQHEDSIAVGNNPVNARGDEIGPGGEIIRTSNEVVQEYYANNPNAVAKSQPVANVSDDLIPDNEREPMTVAPAMSVEEQPAPEVSATPKKTPQATPAISADPTHTADEATQSALEKKIATAKKKAADKAKKAAQAPKKEGLGSAGEASKRPSRRSRNPNVWGSK